MKLVLVSLLLPLIAASASASLSTSSYEEGCNCEEEYDGEYVNLPSLPEVEVWDYLNTETSASLTEKMEIEATPFNWSLRSFFGSFFSSATSPFKQASPPSSALIKCGSDADLDTMSLVINYDKERLRAFDVSIRERVVELKNVESKTEILHHIANFGVKSLFELYFDSNIASIISEINVIRDFNSVAFDCIKIDSTNSLVNLMLNLKFRLNAPHAIVVASMHGSYEVLRYVLEQQNCPDYAWEWKSFDGGDGFMLDFGSDPYSAALFLGSLKAISGGHLNCLKILVMKGANVSFKDYMLLKNSTSIQGSEAFEILLNVSTNISNSLMNEVLLLAINMSNHALVEYLLSRLDYTYNINIKHHLHSAISSNNARLFDLILARVDSSSLNGQTLRLAASIGNVEIFIELLKVSSNELVLSSVCNCITNEALNHLVPHIYNAITLNSEIVMQALLYSVEARSLPLVQLFLNHEVCDLSVVCVPFVEALYANDSSVVNEFLKKFSPKDLIHTEWFSRTISKLFEVEAWNSMKIFVENYFESANFPKRNFVSNLILTDQVEIARIAAEKGAIFPQYELGKISNNEMHAFVIQRIATQNLSKSQLKNRNKH
jgi:hypothetical protein